MNYGYTEIINALMDREPFTIRPQVDKAVYSLFAECKSYWDRFLQYEELKKANSTLRGLRDRKCSYLDLKIISMLWDKRWVQYYSDEEDPRYIDWKVTAKWLKKKGIQDSRVFNAIKNYIVFSKKGTDNRDFKNATKKFEDAFGLIIANKNAQDCSLPECINNVLHEDFRREIVECLRENNPHVDMCLCMEIADARGQFTQGDMEHRRPSSTKKRNVCFFTKECTTEGKDLPTRIKGVIELLNESNGYYETEKYIQTLKTNLETLLSGKTNS